MVTRLNTYSYVALIVMFVAGAPSYAASVGGPYLVGNAGRINDGKGYKEKALREDGSVRVTFTGGQTAVIAAATVGPGRSELEITDDNGILIYKEEIGHSILPDTPNVFMHHFVPRKTTTYTIKISGGEGGGGGNGPVIRTN